MAELKRSASDDVNVGSSEECNSPSISLSLISFGVQGDDFCGVLLLVVPDPSSLIISLQSLFPSHILRRFLRVSSCLWNTWVLLFVSTAVIL